MNNIPELDQIYQEGLFDRLKARAAGFGGGAKALGQNLGKLVKGGTMSNIGDAATQAKLKSITTTFANEMSALFGGNWAATYPNLAKELNGLQQIPTSAGTAQVAPTATTQTPAAAAAPAAVDKNKPLTAQSIVTDKGNPNQKYKVMKDKGQLVSVVPLNRSQRPYGKPIDLNRQTEIVEKKMTIDEAYHSLIEVKQL